MTLFTNTTTPVNQAFVRKSRIETILCATETFECQPKLFKLHHFRAAIHKSENKFGLHKSENNSAKLKQ